MGPVCVLVLNGMHSQSTSVIMVRVIRRDFCRICVCSAVGEPDSSVVCVCVLSCMAVCFQLGAGVKEISSRPLFLKYVTC